MSTEYRVYGSISSLLSYDSQFTLHFTWKCVLYMQLSHLGLVCVCVCVCVCVYVF